MSTYENTGKSLEQKNKVRSRYRGADTTDLEVIPAKPKIDFFKDTSEKRVAVYARVSTDNVQQTSSYEMQQKYYSDFVARHPNWTLVDIYADEGISGTSAKKRKEFMRMIEDCNKNKIEIIVTKSVSRFSRNILDGIGYVRELAAHKPTPIGVYFENEGIYSLNTENEMSISFLTTIAESESRIKSTSMKSSIEMRFSHGIFLTPELLGYDKDENGDLVINQEEARTVRLIFFMYLYGYSTDEIAGTLMSLGRLTKLNNTKWTAGTVLGVLKNERHCGDVLGWKTCTPNFLDHKSVKNRNEHPQYYKRDHHDSIISRDDFLAVQKMIANAKYGGKGFLPKLQVNSAGALRGFVSVNPRWGAFKADDYRNASASVLANT